MTVVLGIVDFLCRWGSWVTCCYTRTPRTDFPTVRDHRVRSSARSSSLCYGSPSGHSLQANTKTLEGNQHIDRDAQFAYLAAQAQGHMASSDPVISVDTKQKKPVGTWRIIGF